MQDAVLPRRWPVMQVMSPILCYCLEGVPAAAATRQRDRQAGHGTQCRAEQPGQRGATRVPRETESDWPRGARRHGWRKTLRFPISWLFHLSFPHRKNTAPFGSLSDSYTCTRLQQLTRKGLRQRLDLSSGRTHDTLSVTLECTLRRSTQCTFDAYPTIKVSTYMLRSIC